MAPCWLWTWWCSFCIFCVNLLFHKSLLFRPAVGFILQHGHSFGPSRLLGSFPCRITTFWRSKDYGKSVGGTQSRETVASFFSYQKTFGKKSPNLGMNLEMNLDISQTFMSNFPHLALCANFWLILSRLHTYPMFPIIILPFSLWICRVLNISVMCFDPSIANCFWRSRDFMWAVARLVARSQHGNGLWQEDSAWDLRGSCFFFDGKLRIPRVLALSLWGKKWFILYSQRHFPDSWNQSWQHGFWNALRWLNP